MADESENVYEPPARSYRYLPYLTSALLALMVLYVVVWFAYYRPTKEEQLQIAAFRDALHFIPGAYVKEVDRTELYRAAMRGMLKSLDDGYSDFFTPTERERLQDKTEGEYVGIGVKISIENGHPVIREVREDGPAAEAGIEAADIITHVDAKEVKGMSLRDVARLIRGKVGTTVELQLRRPSTDETLAIEVKRKIITIENVKWNIIEDGIARLRLESFDKDCAREVKRALTDLVDKGLRGLIFDLRGNSGGIVTQTVLICDLFLSEGLILGIKGREETHENSYKASAGVVVDAGVPVVVLVNGASASASEIVAGALQANGRAAVMGRKTVGKGTVTNVRKLPDGSGINLVIAHYQLADGKIVEGEGIIPDIELDPPPRFPKDADAQKVKAWVLQCKASQEAELQKAVEYLKEQLSKS